MKIAVLVKEVPDTWGDRKLDLTTGLVDRAASEPVLDEIGERAIEVALTYADAHPGTEVMVVSMGPESAGATIRKGLAMGAASAVLVADPRLAGADMTLTAEVLAAVLRQERADLIVTGNVSTDGSGGVLPVMIAELLDLPSATNLETVEIAEESVKGRRVSEGGSVEVTASLPAIISITERHPDARFPNFKGIMAAKKKPFRTLSLSDLGVDPDDQGAARSIVVSVSPKPPRAAGTKIVDEGDGGRKLAEFLITNNLA